MSRVLTPARGALAAAIIGSLTLPALAQSQLGRAINTGEQATRRAEQVQNRINQLDDERSDMVSEFRTLLQRKQAAELYVRQQEKVIESQEREEESLIDQLGRVDEITAQTVPMLRDMVSDLENFVRADLPFKIEDRMARIELLKTAMESADVPIVEQYRLIIEAYKTEMEYGRTVQTWPEDVIIDGETVKVDMFLYGRVALVYLSPDRRHGSRFDRETGEWVDVDSAFKDEIAAAIRQAQGKSTPGVMYAPATKLSVQ
ncbi:MAG: hypothetical protein CBB77_03580 [Hyphomonas sp. TMED17]|nr:MAG: hypothetical protein CBB77_03580 [Hyphomonas sp. TMED17]